MIIVQTEARDPGLSIPALVGHWSPPWRRHNFGQSSSLLPRAINGEYAPAAVSCQQPVLQKLRDVCIGPVGRHFLGQASRHSLHGVIQWVSLDYTFRPFLRNLPTFYSNQRVSPLLPSSGYRSNCPNPKDPTSVLIAQCVLQVDERQAILRRKLALARY